MEALPRDTFVVVELLGGRSEGWSVESAETCLNVLAGRWRLKILKLIIVKPVRLSSLQRQLKGISKRILIFQIRELEALGVVRREVGPPGSRRVDIWVTPRGVSLVPLLEMMSDWGRKNPPMPPAGDPSTVPLISDSG